MPTRAVGAVGEREHDARRRAVGAAAGGEGGERVEEVAVAVGVVGDVGAEDDVKRPAVAAFARERRRLRGVAPHERRDRRRRRRPPPAASELWAAFRRKSGRS